MYFDHQEEYWPSMQVRSTSTMYLRKISRYLQIMSVLGLPSAQASLPKKMFRMLQLPSISSREMMSVGDLLQDPAQGLRNPYRNQLPGELSIPSLPKDSMSRTLYASICGPSLVAPAEGDH
jgi:hypothetical protein